MNNGEKIRGLDYSNILMPMTPEQIKTMKDRYLNLHFTSRTRFTQWFTNHDFPMDIRNPLLKVDKPLRLELLEDIAIQPWERQQMTINILHQALIKINDINDAEIKEYGPCDHSIEIKALIEGLGIYPPKELQEQP